MDVLDRPPGVEGSGTYQYRPSPGQDELIQVFYLPNTGSAKRRPQELALWVGEATLDPDALSCTPACSALIVRGTADQVALAGQLRKNRTTP